MEIEENTDVENPETSLTTENSALPEAAQKETPKFELRKHLRLPLARVKNMMKLDPDCLLISQDSLFLITKVTEMFIEYLAIESGKNLANGKRKTVLKRDVEAAIESIPSLCFLDGALE